MFGLYATGIVGALVVAGVLRLTIMRGSQQPLVDGIAELQAAQSGQCAVGVAGSRQNLFAPGGHH
jgi:Fe2+ transport system protein B